MSTSTPRPTARTDGRWTYGEAWEKYPVEPGQVWAIGPHRVMAGDLELGDALAFLAHPEVPTPGLGYADPPWTPSNASGFRTKAGAESKADWSLLQRRVAEAMLVPALSFCEMGLTTTEDFVATVKKAGGNVYSVQQINDPPNRFTCNLVALGYEPQVPIGSLRHLTKPRALTGLETPGWAIQNYSQPRGVVYDCCLGRGLTAVTAHDLGRVCIGTELNPRRLAVAIAKLVDAGAGEPTVVGSI